MRSPLWALLWLSFTGRYYRLRGHFVPTNDSSTYIVIYAITQPLLGRHVDSVNNAQVTIRPAIRNIAGIQFTIISLVMFCSTFIPQGALAFNPKMLNEEQLDTDLEQPDVRQDSDEDLKKYHHNGTIDDRRQSVTRASVGIEDTFQPDMQIIAAHEKTNLAKA